jgi:hypothetical protein
LPPVIVFTTASDIEASVVMALLDSHGIDAFRASGNIQALWPMAVSALGPIRIAVPAALAAEARLGYRAPDGRYWRIADRLDPAALRAVDALWLEAAQRHPVAA